MLVSYNHKFIFFKTKKTASTSIEIYFEKYCSSERDYQPQHYRPSEVSEYGIIGSRGREFQDYAEFRSHDAAAKIRNYLGEGQFKAFFKFTTVRNPFDKMVSGYRYFEQRRLLSSNWPELKSVAKRLLRRAKPIDKIAGRDEITRFRNWVKAGGCVKDYDTHMINGEPCSNYYIRYENIEEDLRVVCEKIGLPYDASELGAYKRGTLATGKSYQDFYDEESYEIVKKLYDWEITKFGYSL